MFYIYIPLEVFPDSGLVMTIYPQTEPANSKVECNSKAMRSMRLWCTQLWMFRNDCHQYDLGKVNQSLSMKYRLLKTNNLFAALRLAYVYCPCLTVWYQHEQQLVRWSVFRFLYIFLYKPQLLSFEIFHSCPQMLFISYLYYVHMHKKNT